MNIIHNRKERLYLTAMMDGSWGKWVNTVNKIMTWWPRIGDLFIVSAEILLISVMLVPKIQMDKHCIVWTSIGLHLNYIVTNSPAVGQFNHPIHIANTSSSLSHFALFTFFYVRNCQIFPSYIFHQVYRQYTADWWACPIVRKSGKLYSAEKLQEIGL